MKSSCPQCGNLLAYGVQCCFHCGWAANPWYGVRVKTYACPSCGQPVAQRSHRCTRCGWISGANPPVIVVNHRFCHRCGSPVSAGQPCAKCGTHASNPPSRMKTMSVCLAVMLCLLLITSSCAFHSLTGKHGDDLGYGLIAVIESLILVVTAVWLGVGLSLQSELPKYRKWNIARSVAGVTVGLFTCCLAIANFNGFGSLPKNIFSATMLGVAGVGLLWSSIRTLRGRP